MSSYPHAVLVDADILIKLAVFDCFTECLRTLGYSIEHCVTLQSMAFSAGLRKRAVREKKAGSGQAAERLLKLLQAIPTIDKLTPDEQGLAAVIGQQSQLLNLSIDGGEAMLLSIAVHRGLPYLVTGDKRAVRSLPRLANVVASIQELRKRVVCLERLLLNLVRDKTFNALEARLIAGAHCDKAVSEALVEANSKPELFMKCLEFRIGLLCAAAPGFLLD